MTTKEVNLGNQEIVAVHGAKESHVTSETEVVIVFITNKQELVPGSYDWPDLCRTGLKKHS